MVAADAVCVAVLLHFEVFRNGDRHLVTWPSFGVVRPVVLLALLPFPAVVLSHWVFRWMVREE